MARGASDTFRGRITKLSDVGGDVLNAWRLEYPVPFWAYSILAVYGVLTLYGAFWMLRKIFRACRAAAKVSPLAGYAAQFLSWGFFALMFAMPVLFNTGSASAQEMQKQGVWLMLTACLGAAFNYWRMRKEAERKGVPVPSFRQIQSWVSY